MATPTDCNAMVDEFIASDPTPPLTQHHHLRRLFTVISEREPTTGLVPTEEVEERLQYLSKLQKFWKARWSAFTGQHPRQFKPIHPIITATVMMMDLASVRDMFNEALNLKLRHAVLSNLLRDLCVLPCFVKTTMTEKRKRRIIDNHRCVLTHWELPAVCSIIPSGLNSREPARLKLRSYLGPAISCIFTETPTWIDGPPEPDPDGDFKFEDPPITEEDEMDITVTAQDPPSDLFALFCRKVFASSARVSKNSWNEISLEPKLLTYWEQGFFALKPLGIDGKLRDEVPDAKGNRTVQTRVKVQFYWMPQQRGSRLRIDNDTTAEEVLGIIRKTYGVLDHPADERNPVFSQDHNHRSSPAHLLEDGYVFYLPVAMQYADRMLAALHVQWAVTKVFALAKGAEALDDVGDHPEYLDKNLDWIGYRYTTVRETVRGWDSVAW
ncbi:hypothetical protein QBC34DRAFT_464486 [Podospora aff. communis PSN243]|uniref:HNH nuclease domain-containing protein n=1 Tax=Podospora aff. communis PSN243 TaxID=3040156 RepID=A0AAV9GLY8_9PEZI|nr:hypothetical protein QBC34DRAFT_464486 [Podospora aff. communis PSN243]